MTCSGSARGTPKRRAISGNMDTSPFGALASSSAPERVPVTSGGEREFVQAHESAEDLNE